MRRLAAWALSLTLLALRGRGEQPGASPGGTLAPPQAPPGEWPPARRRWLLTAAALVAMAGLAGGAVLLAGLVPVKASAGHWAVTEWILQLGKRRSVATHTLGIDVPARLGDAGWVLKGAGHFELGCSPCHGSPVQPPPRVVRAMLPPPPPLAERVPRWDDAELFYIVRHGIKLTGMPAWPARGRDDEVWAVVAFLKTLPALDGPSYARLVFGGVGGQRPVADIEGLEQPQPPSPAAGCVRCHGRDGLGRGLGVFPRLAGQSRGYLLAALEAYARDTRASGIMQPVAAALESSEMAALADHFAALAPATSPGGDAAEAAVERGRRIALEGIPRQRVPSCADCHGPGPRPRNAHYPGLSGQYAEYLVLQLTLFKQGRRGGSRFASLMRPVAERLTEAQIADVAAYFASTSDASVGR